MIRQLIENQGGEGGKYERMLGSKDAVNAVAQFQQNHAKLLQLIATNALIKFCEEQTFSDVEYARFADGVATMGAEFQACWQERQDILRNQNLPLDPDEPQDSD